MAPRLSGRQTLLLGGLLLLALVLGAAGLFSIGDRQGIWRPQTIVYARFPRINGVEPGTRVRLKGINVGQVVAIEPMASRSDDVALRLVIDAPYFDLLGANSEATIVSEGLIGSKVLELDPGTPDAAPLEAGATITGKPDNFMSEMKRLAERGHGVVDEVQSLARQGNRTMTAAEDLVQELRHGQGILGREVVQSLRQFQQTTDSVGHGFDAMRNVPLVGRYVDNSTKTLVRPKFDRYPFVFSEAELFEKGKAVLTAEGKSRLDTLAGNDLPRFNVSGSEIVVASYVDQQSNEGAAEILTQEQGEAVRSYLVDNHKVNKLGWWHRRNVTALGMGTRPSPIDQPAALPARRIEIIVFVPPEAK